MSDFFNTAVDTDLNDLRMSKKAQPLLEAVVENFVTHLASINYRVVGVGFIGVRYVFEVSSAALCLLAPPGLTP